MVDHGTILRRRSESEDSPDASLRETGNESVARATENVRGELPGPAVSMEGQPAKVGHDDGADEPVADDLPGKTNTLAAMGKKMVYEAIVSGSLSDIFAGIIGMIQKTGVGLKQAEELVNVLKNITEQVKESLARPAEVQPIDKEGSRAIFSSATLTSLQLFWNLVKTPELQSLAANLISQVLKP